MLVGYTVVFPLVDWLPLHPPEAVQLVAVLDHESVVAWPLARTDDDTAMKSNNWGCCWAFALQGQSVVAASMIASPYP